MEEPVLWEFKLFDELNVYTLYDLIQLRNEVFVVGQDCVYQDADGLDRDAIHVLGYIEDKLVAYCRIFPPDIVTPGLCSFGRVAVAVPWRGTGIGRALINETKAYLKQRWPQGTTLIHAQHYLHDFYLSLDFVQCSEVYDEVGIPHIHMKWQHEI